MSLVSRCKHAFDDRDLANGRIYFEQGQVAIIGSDGSGFGCEVKGSQRRPYAVEIEWYLARKSDVLIAYCNCPRFADAEICKHVAAALFAADAAGLGNRVVGTQALGIITAEDADSFDYLDDEDDDDFDEPIAPRRALALEPADPRHPKSKSAAAGKPPSWKNALLAVRDISQAMEGASASDSLLAVGRRAVEVWYVISSHSMRDGLIVIDFYQREPLQAGGLGKLKPLRIASKTSEQVADPIDCELLDLLIEVQPKQAVQHYSIFGEPTHQRSTLTPALHEYLLPRLAATGRLAFTELPVPDLEHLTPLEWDGGPPWRFEMQIELDAVKKQWRVYGHLTRAGQVVELDAPRMFLSSGLVLIGNRLGHLDASNAFAWLEQFGKYGPLLVPQNQQDAFVEQLWQLPHWPPLTLPPELTFATIEATPRPQIVIQRPPNHYRNEPLLATVVFNYQGVQVPWNDRQTAIVNARERSVYVRQIAAELARLEQLNKAGVKPTRVHLAKPGQFDVLPRQLPIVVRQLVAQGWKVEAEGMQFRSAGNFSMRVASGVDWFDLDAQCDFDGLQVGLPELLQALKNGQNFVELGDGSRGMLPETWLNRYAPLASMAEIENGKLRFRPSQALLLDALLSAQPEANVDARFRKAREKLQSFAGIQAVSQPAGFVGTLRDYQQTGLGWLGFLQEFGFGGCLADDMGLGKTIQVLAMLEAQRTRRKRPANAPRTSLAVVPKSLIHNWLDEAARFTPNLHVLNHTGLGRAKELAELSEYDLVLTTYGTLRRDIVLLKDFRFNVAILDEAQAIKNASSDAAKACRLVQADHRLAMTGTPVENHLGELWSLFEFLNPGMLGRAEAFKRYSASAGTDNPEAIGMLSRALRPYLLRRTKDQVLSQLPEKIEQTLYCELEGKQRTLYNELREHYRLALTERIDQVGLKRAKIHVLEALLRLRQAACHPGLVDKSRASEPSAKLELLLEQLEQVLDEGHKALVFSQFTSLLAIVRERLDAKKMTYAYLDGKTRDRKTCVARFQEDADCKLFLISLKAGGLGLNLTAADYVFILDPWWNPAVEAQAVDRAHRLGQTRSVTAYRLIASDTVEEKIMQLQGSKRQLADAIISADNSVISSLTAEDLQLLLS